MSPECTAFLSAVIRFLALHFDPERPDGQEYRRIREFLREPSAEFDVRGAWERRTYRRMVLRDVVGTLHVQGRKLQGIVRDLSATGVRMDGVPRPLPGFGERAILTIHPPGSVLRVDFPTEIVRSPDAGSCCLQFRGMPLLLNRRTRPALRKRMRISSASGMELTAAWQPGGAPIELIEPDSVAFPEPGRKAA